METKRRLPDWLKRRLPAGKDYKNTHNVLTKLGIETVCTNANCPNMGICWDKGTATVLILGNICTRNCKYCSVAHGKPEPPDPAEPNNIAQMAKEMGLKYLVITSVDRDDLQDGGASQFRDVINASRETVEDIEFELLVPDFKGCQEEALDILESALPFVFGHNIETVPSLYSSARSGGDYHLSLKLLEKAKHKYPNTETKSSLMLGLGEKENEVIQSMKDLRSVGCDRIAIGQYLKPSRQSLDVIEYVEPAKFDWWAQKAKELGFTWVMSSPFTRSSFHAEMKATDNQK